MTTMRILFVSWLVLWALTLWCLLPLLRRWFHR